MLALGGEQTLNTIVNEMIKRYPDSPSRGSLRTMVAYGSQGRYKRWDRAGYGVYKPLVMASSPESPGGADRVCGNGVRAPVR